MRNGKRRNGGGHLVGGHRVDVNSLEQSEGWIWKRRDLVRKNGGASRRSITRHWSIGRNPAPLLLPQPAPTTRPCGGKWNRCWLRIRPMHWSISRLWTSRLNCSTTVLLSPQAPSWDRI